MVRCNWYYIEGVLNILFNNKAASSGGYNYIVDLLEL